MVRRAALLVAATLATGAGCAGSSPEGLTVQRCGALPPIEKLTVTVVGPARTLVREQPFPAGGGPPQLPGRLQLDAGGRRDVVRVLVTAWQGVYPVGFGVARVDLATRTAETLCLEGPFPTDRDGDGIPDREDRCPQIPDAEQEDRNGDGVSDVCSLVTDGGPPADAAPDRSPADAARDGEGGSPGCASGDPCDDGDPCTTGDLCALEGTCRGFPATDGTSCGPEPGRRCCGGQCIGIWGDENNCGGCGLRCAPGYDCEGVAWTGQCSAYPHVTSGRCMCANGNDALCPNGQACRTDAPVANRCAPKQGSHCAPSSRLKWLTDCPNYCYYD